METYKKLIHILILIIGAALFTGCNNHDSEVPQPESIMQDGEYEGLGEDCSDSKER